MGAGFFTLQSMPADRKPVGFVSNGPDQQKTGTIRLGHQYALAVGNDKPFLPRNPVRALGNADNADRRNLQFLEHSGSGAYLAATAVDEQDVRQLALAFLQSCISAFKRLSQGSIIVAGRDT